MHPKHLSISDYTYPLPDKRIAAFPLERRDESKLLIYRNGSVTEDIYRNIASHLPSNPLLVFNNTRVIPARILFQKPSGGVIEIFCLEPAGQQVDYNLVMQQKGSVRWKCMIGGASKWKEGLLEKLGGSGELQHTIHAKLVEKLPDAYVVELSWQPASLSFAEVIALDGNIPLPPYIKRKPVESDKERYQTIYAEKEGSVAAPTAGLHFTPGIFSSLENIKAELAYVTLHVGAGTFKPVKAEQMEGHEMHAEWIDVNITTIHQLCNHAGKNIIAVGTTSLRTIESIYWMGVKTILNPSTSQQNIFISQWDVYDAPLVESAFSATESLQSLLKWMEKNKMERLVTRTQILIAPGYRFRLANALVTNFHQPQSTLLLLVAAAVGNDWNNIYQYALDHDFRFLSYGDGSLLYFNQ